ncbi:trypsin-like peptidase domain-containing protein [Agarivorans sp. TSD2052]|uniref:trypsin-like peptidase domain-containing protein n=1 Tax=Agarivorans sp. TSD2052 TaxID=2937286 RepID=UPI00200CB92D|nr:trypsin-like peptidase domain-containing protein [Agarivorans sp. TSD2052]UPW18846.1 trypsin-like peptidase domain-containing protein [Agarivorans sp. TSD2052]
MYQNLANATFRIECHGSSGSGFSFRDDKTILTNHHVIENHISSGNPIFAVTESGQKLRVTLKNYSHKSKYDFAVLELVEPLPDGRIILHPEEPCQIPRGRKILFAGFPHGIHDLLVHEAIISGPSNSHAFYIDGSVNGGNSGGPIVDCETGSVIGIVTQRRFLGGDSLQALGQPIAELSSHCQAIANNGSVNIMGVDFGQFANLIANGLGAITSVLEANANTGIGIGFKIDFANQECINPTKNNTVPTLTGVARNAQCPCGSGKRYKECCGKLV